MSDNWICPHCLYAQAFTARRYEYMVRAFEVTGSAIEDPGLAATIHVCANEKCRKVTLSAWFGQTVRVSHPHGVRTSIPKPKNRWNLIPSSSAKVQPNYIPAPIVEDSDEACSIRDLSPKASATLSRRCLQGMIRDFCGITKGTLAAEIAELKKAVDEGRAPRGVQAETLDAIDAVRKVGNIGAHMEKDINIIIDVEPGEAQALITLIEMLFEDWYVQRHNRQERLNAVQALGASKDAAKKLAQLGPVSDSSDPS